MTYGQRRGTRTRRFPSWFLVALVATLVAGECSDDDDDSGAAPVATVHDVSLDLPEVIKQSAHYQAVCSTGGFESMQVRIDAELCQGHQMCAIRAPEVFGSDDEGYGIVLIDGDVPAELEESARQAVNACPERAVSVEA